MLPSILLVRFYVLIKSVVLNSLSVSQVRYNLHFPKYVRKSALFLLCEEL